MTPALLVVTIGMHMAAGRHSPPRHIQSQRSVVSRLDPNGFATMPCCAVESIDFQNQYVRIRDRATGREYNVHIDDAAKLAPIRVGSKVFAALRGNAAPEYEIAPCCAVEAP